MGGSRCGGGCNVHAGGRSQCSTQAAQAEQRPGMVDDGRRTCDLASALRDGDAD